MHPILVAFIAFFATLTASLIGSLLAPSFGQFLSFHKNKRDERLKYLEETYILAKQINTYSNQVLSHILFLIAAQTNKIDPANTNKLPDEPFSRIDTLLDYHLDAPSDFITRIRVINSEILYSFRPIAEAINSPTNKDEFYSKAIEQCINATKKAPDLSNQLIAWAKSEKEKIELSPSLFQKTFWANHFSRIILHIKKYRILKTD